MGLNDTGEPPMNVSACPHSGTRAKGSSSPGPPAHSLSKLFLVACPPPKPHWPTPCDPSTGGRTQLWEVMLAGD